MLVVTSTPCGACRARKTLRSCFNRGTVPFHLQSARNQLPGLRNLAETRKLRTLAQCRIGSESNRSSCHLSNHRREFKTRLAAARERVSPYPRTAYCARIGGLSYRLASKEGAVPRVWPNPSIERTRSGSAGLAFISFWAKPAPPPRAAHVKR